MINFTQTADALERMAVQQQAMTEAAAAFRSLGSIESATKEATDKRTMAEGLLADSLEALAKAQSDLDKTRANIDRQLEDANKLADQRVADAKAEALTIVSGAKTESDTILAAAREQADKLIVDTNEDLVSVREELEQRRAEVRDAEERLAGLTTAANEAQKRLDATREAISKLAAGL